MLGFLSGLRNFGFVLAAFLLFLSITDRRLLIVWGIFLIANVLLAKGSRAAAIVLVLVALGMGAYLEHDYRSALERLEVRAAAQSGRHGSVQLRASVRSFTTISRTLALFWVGASVIYLGGVGIVWAYRRRVPQIQSQLHWGQRLTLQAAILHAQMSPKAIIYFGLAVTCFLIAMGPMVGPLIASLLHLKLSGVSASIGEWSLEPLWGWLLPVLSLVGVLLGLNFFVRAKRYGAQAQQMGDVARKFGLEKVL